jgi:hypothetical protein
MPLTCARHTVAVYDRGGRQRIGTIDPLTSVRWSRVRDDMSMASLVTVSPSWECREMLKEVEANRHELVIFRDGERVWEGPITLITYGSTSITIEARDVMYYVHRTIMHAEYSNAYGSAAGVMTVVDRAEWILNGELARKEALDPPINVLPYLMKFNSPDPANTAKATLPYSSLVYEEIDELASRSGLDYTVVGRAIILFDRHVAFSTTPAVSEADFIGEIIVSMYGLEGGTAAYVTDGKGNYGLAGGDDPYYGEIELLDTAYQESTDPNAVAPTQAEMNSQAIRNLNGRNPTPVIVRIPDGSRLNPDGVLSMKDLIPGIRVPLRATLTARTFSQLQKLDNVRVDESASNGEAIVITLSPADHDDVPPVEE